jgi:hypothetical protein
MTQYQDIASNEIAVPVSNGKPECLLTWVRKDEGGIRLYASRDLPGASWGQRTIEGGTEVHWHLAATMRSTIIMDADTPAQAIQWVLERWAREDEAERLRVLRLQQHARAGMVVNDPKAITNIGGGGMV